MALLPWEQGGSGFYPWMVGGTFVGSDGATYTTYADPNSPTGYTARRQDANGTSFQPINAPTDPLAQTTYIENSPYGRRLTAAEQAAAEQNKFNRGIQTGQLGVSRQNANTSRYSAETSRMSARAQIEQAKQDLALRMQQEAHQYELGRGNLGLNTLQLGASLHGPRNWDSYLETASRAGQNPILQGALGTWSSLTNVRPNTGAVAGPLPQRFDLNALAGDFMGGGQGSGGGVYDPMQHRDQNLDRVAMGGSSPGWWQSLSPDERERAKGYWEQRGWSSDDVLSRLSYTAANQGLGYAGA